MRYLVREKIILIFFILTVTFNCYSQKSDTIYFHGESELLPNGQYFKKYLRILNKENDSLYFVNDYHKNGEIQMTGKYKSPKQKIRVGKFEWFNKRGEKILLLHYQYDLVNDTIKSHLTNKYSELNKNDSLQINYLEYFKRGDFCSGVMVNDNAFGIWIFRNKKMELSQSLEYSNNVRNGNYKAYFNSDDKVNSSFYGDVHYTGQYINDKKDGEWIFYEPNKTVYRRIEYKSGKKIQDIKY